MDIRQCANFWNDQFQQDQQKRLPPAEKPARSCNNKHSANCNRNTSTLINASSYNLIQSHYSPMSQKGDNKNQWTEEQQDLLFKLHQQQGNKWSSLAFELPTRNQNSIKNKFYSTLRKGFRKLNKYITNVRRKTHPAQMSNNKLVKPDFLTKLTAIADRNYEEKYEVKPMAVNLSQTVQRKLIQLARNHFEYSKNEDHETYEAQQDLLQDIFEFRKNCKKRKGKRKVGSGNISSEQDESVQHSQDIPAIQINKAVKEVSFKQLQHKEQKSSVGAKTKNQGQSDPKEVLQQSELFQVPPFHQKRQKSDDKAVCMEPYQLLRSELLVEEEDDPKNGYSDHEQSVTSKCNNSLHHIIDPSPSNNKQFNSFSEAFLKNIKRVQISAHMSQASDLAPHEEINFLEKVPMHSQSGVQFFKSSQLSKVCQSTNLSFSNKSQSKMYLSDVYLGKNQTQNCVKEVNQENPLTPCFMTESSFPTKKMTSRGTSIHQGDLQ